MSFDPYLLHTPQHFHSPHDHFKMVKRSFCRPTPENGSDFMNSQAGGGIRKYGGGKKRKVCTRGHWRPPEDAKLIELVGQYGPRNWNYIAENLHGRSGKSCRLRWFNQLDPRINRSEFTAEEEEQLLEAHKVYGNKWATIAGMFSGRTDNAVKNHWHVIMARRHRERNTNIFMKSRTESNSVSLNGGGAININDEYANSSISSSDNCQLITEFAASTCTIGSLTSPCTRPDHRLIAEFAASTCTLGSLTECTRLDHRLNKESAASSCNGLSLARAGCNFTTLHSCLASRFIPFQNQQDSISDVSATELGGVSNMPNRGTCSGSKRVNGNGKEKEAMQFIDFLKVGST